MNILFLTTHLNTGGITSYLLGLADALVKKGHKVFIASSGGNMEEEFKKRRISLFNIPIRTKSELSLLKMTRSLFLLLSFIRDKKIDILHSNTRVTQVLGCCTGFFAKIPHVSTCHGFFKPHLARRVFPCWGDRVIAVSDSVKEHLRLDFFVREEKIRLIYNGIDISRFLLSSNKEAGIQEEVKKSLGCDSCEPLVGIIGRLSDVKGHSFLIKAMKEVAEKIPGVRLLIVGEGRMKDKLIRLIDSLNMQKIVFFIPRIDDTADILFAFDVFVMPSLREGLGLSLMEAMAAGLPVIGSNVGGIKNLIQHGHNGIFVEPEDVGSLAQAISRLLTNKDESRYLGKNAKEFIARNFSIEKMVSETETVYSEIISCAKC